MGSGEERDSEDDTVVSAPPKDGAEPDDVQPDTSGFDGMDTTSWSGSAPPVLIEGDDEEEETIL